MTAKFEDDAADGDGKRATKQDAIAVRNWLRSRNMKDNYPDVLRELLARNFKTSKATVGRLLKGEPDAAPRKTVTEEQTAMRKRKEKRKQYDKSTPPPQTVIAAAIVDEVNKGKDKEADQANAERFTIDGIAKQDITSTMLAILENRERMALNILLIRHMADNPKLLLLDMRGAAALVDSLTIAAKLSGGASIDIRMPTLGELTNGQDADLPMKDVTPIKTPLMAEIEKWRNEQRPKKHVNGEGA